MVMFKMKSWIIKTVKRFVKPVANKFGYFQPENSKNKLIYCAFNYLKSNGFQPSLVLDVGSNHGNWSREVMTIFSDSEFLLIEPQAYLEKSIEDLKSKGKVEFFPIGIGNHNGLIEFSINESDDSSSFIPNDFGIKGYDFIKKIKVEMKTLDTFLSDEGLPIPDLVKIDAEGLDFEVLECASSIFGITECILVEASIHQKAFPNSLLKIMKFMDEKGYEIFDFTDLNRPFSNGLLWLVEVMFVKKDSKFV